MSLALLTNAGVDDGFAPNAGVDSPNPPPKGLLPGWLLPNADDEDPKENADELALKAGVLLPKRPPDEEAAPKLKAMLVTARAFAA